MVRRVCVQWPRLGPYHLARLHAAHRYLRTQGAELVALETASRDTYAWQVEQGPTSFARHCVFPNSVFETLAPETIYQAVTDHLDRLNPDAVAIHSYSFPDARACLAWCRRHQRTAVIMYDSREDDGPRVAWREWIKRRIVGLYDAGLAAGTPQRAYLVKLGLPADAIFLGYDVVDNAFFRGRAAAFRALPTSARSHFPGLTGVTPFFLAVNRFLPFKNLDGLLLAYAAYRERTAAPWRLILVGDGPIRSSLERIIAERHIEGVVLTGFLQIDDIPAYYGLAGAFIHPTHKDTWGLVVNEAMATGLPVVVSERAGCAYDLVDEGKNGFAFDPDDLHRLTELMLHLSDPATDRATLGRNARATIDAWSLDLFAESLWKAVQAGSPRAKRPFPLHGQVLLKGLRRATRSVDSFHSIEA